MLLFKRLSLVLILLLALSPQGFAAGAATTKSPQEPVPAMSPVACATPLTGVSSDLQQEFSAAALSGDPLALLHQMGAMLIAHKCYVASETEAAAVGLPGKVVIRNLIRLSLSYVDEGQVTESQFEKVYDIAEELAANKVIGLGDDDFAAEIKSRRESAKTRQFWPPPPPPPPPPMWGPPGIIIGPPGPMWGTPPWARPPWARPPWARPPWARPPVFW